MGRACIRPRQRPSPAPICTAMALLLAGALPAPAADPSAAEHQAVTREAGSSEPGADALLPLYVITAEEIRQSGATSVAEVLRFAPGLDIVTLGARNRVVAVRGMPEGVADAGVLVMVDGRAVNGGASGAVPWDLLSVPLASVERIEVLRSPASSLYGPGACTGVINIITRSPGSQRGLEVSLTGGEYGTLIGAALFGISSGRLGLNVSAEVDQTGEWPGSGQPAGDVVRVNGTLRYRYGEQGAVTFSMGRAHTDQARLPAHPAAGTLAMSGSVNHADLEATWRRWLCRVSLRNEDFAGDWQYADRELHWLSSAFDAVLRHSFAAGRRSTVTWGIDYRALTLAPNDLVPSYHAQHLAGAFAGDDVRLGERWRAGLGVRYDYHPLAGSTVSSHGALAFSPAPRHTLRLLASTGARNPSMLDSYAGYSVRDTAAGVTVTDVAGERNLEARKVYGAEVGYHGEPVRRLTADIALYYRYHRGLYDWRVDTAWTAAPDSAGLERRVNDEGRAHGLGGEIDVQYRIAEWLVVKGNYSLQGLLDAGAEPAAGYRCAPRNKFNAGLHATMAGFRAGVWLHWSEATLWKLDDSRGGSSTHTLGQRLLVNARVGYAIKNAEVSAAVFDLFDRKYREYPRSAGGDELRQKVTVQLACRF